MTATRQLRILGTGALLGICALAALPGPVAARPGTTPGCGTTTAASQNGNQLYLAGAGPNCLFRAFGTCRATVLSVHGRGVDTQLVLTFSVTRKGTACRVVVAGSHTVFYGGKTRKTTWTNTCTGATKRAEGIVIRGCRDGDYLLSPPGAPEVPNNRF